MDGLVAAQDFSLVSMDTFRRERPDAGRRVAARRKYVGKTQEGIEEETNGILKQRLLSRIEKTEGEDAKSVGSLSVTQLSALLAVLEWTPEEFEEETGVQLPARVPNATPNVPTMKLPFMGSVSAGVSLDQEEPTEYRYYDPRTDGLKGRRQDVLAEFRVNGDSMVSDGAREDTVKDGSTVIVEFGAPPQHGDLVVAWIDDLQTAVLKRYEEGPETILRSYNPNGPVFRSGQHRIDVRGVVRLVQNRPRQR